VVNKSTNIWSGGVLEFELEIKEFGVETSTFVMINLYLSLDGKIDYNNSVGNLNLFTAKTKIYISRISLINIYWPN